MALTLQQFRDWIDKGNIDNRVFVITLTSSSGAVLYYSDNYYPMGGGLICDNWIIELPYIEESLDGRSFGSFSLVDMLENNLGNNYVKGWQWSLKYGDTTWPFSDFKLIASGIVSDVQQSNDIYTISLENRDSKLDKPILTNQSDILCIGSCFNYEPVLLSGISLQYRVNKGAVSFISVYDRGVLLNSGVNRDLANGTFTLTNSPAGLITINSSSSNQSLEDAVLRLAQMAGYDGVYYKDISTQRKAYTVGLIIRPGGTTYREALQKIADSIGAYVIENASENALIFMCLSNVSPVPVITDDQLIDGSIKQAGILAAANKITIGYTKNYRKMEQSEIAYSAIQSSWSSAQLMMQDRSEVTATTTIANSYNYSEIDIDSVLRNANDAESEKQYITQKRNYDRRIYSVQLTELANILNIGDFVYLSSTAIPFSMGYVQKIKRWSNGLLSELEILEL